MRGTGAALALALALALAGCSASHLDSRNTSGSNWLRCSTLADCAGAAEQCSGDGYCLDPAGQRIASDTVDAQVADDADAASDGGLATQRFTLCDGSPDVRLALASTGGALDPSDAFTNPYGTHFLFIDGMCNYYASTSWLLGTTVGQLSPSQAADIEQRMQLSALSTLAYHDLESCPDAGYVWVRAAAGYADCSCSCDSAAPALAASLLGEADALRNELIATGSRSTGALELFALELEDGGAAQPNDQLWPFAFPVEDVAVSVDQLSREPNVPSRRELDGEDARLARSLTDVALRQTPNTGRVRVVSAGKGYLVYMRDVLPAEPALAIEQVVRAQTRVLAAP